VDVQEQLALLRRKISRIDRKFTTGAARPLARPEPPPAHYTIDETMSGEVVETSHGSHFETERVYERHRRWGSMDLSNLIELPADLLDSITGGVIPNSPPGRWAFLDTETTGLAGGTGTYAILIGVGAIDASGFRVRQFFMRDYGEEASLLDRLAEHLSRFDVLITYNGKTYDQPLLETRYTLARRKPPFARMEHLDLLAGARRLWKLRCESCRLVDLENQILGVEREGDLPGELIPYYYFDFLRRRQALQLVPIFHHNAMDILSLACLTAVVPFAFRSPDEAPLRHGADFIGLARWFEKGEQFEQSLKLLRRAVDIGLPDSILFRALWDIGRLEKKLGREAASLASFTELAASRNPYRAAALRELAKYYEHRERNHSMALEMIRGALGIEETPEDRRRERRLEERIRRGRSGRLGLAARESC
jgi:uncharacterized protein YprB with RNaseH-like and TPR domain